MGLYICIKILLGGGLRNAILLIYIVNGFIWWNSKFIIISFVLRNDLRWKYSSFYRYAVFFQKCLSLFSISILSHIIRCHTKNDFFISVDFKIKKYICIWLSKHESSNRSIHLTRILLVIWESMFTAQQL